jgi:hypothetical protein
MKPERRSRSLGIFLNKYRKEWAMEECERSARGLPVAWVP